MIGQQVRVAGRVGTIERKRVFAGQTFFFVRLSDNSEICVERSEIRSL
jgi:hypothetical protein